MGDPVESAHGLNPADCQNALKSDLSPGQTAENKSRSKRKSQKRKREQNARDNLSF